MEPDGQPRVRMIADVLTSDSSDTGTYYDETGKPMLGSSHVRDPEFSDRVVAETRALLATTTDDPVAGPRPGPSPL